MLLRINFLLFQTLTELNIGCNKISDEGVRHLAEHSNIQYMKSLRLNIAFPLVSVA